MMDDISRTSKPDAGGFALHEAGGEGMEGRSARKLLSGLGRFLLPRGLESRVNSKRFRASDVSLRSLDGRISSVDDQ